MKRLLSLALVLVMMLSVMTCIGMAEEEREVVTITMLSLPANVSGRIENTWWADYLMEKLGIIVELVPGSGDDSKLTALMAAEALPDMIVFKDGTQVVNCVEANMLVALDDYADQMPNAQKYMKESMAYYADTYSNDGKCYAISNNVGAVAKNGRLNWSTAIRWDLYKKIGMPEITTAWDYLDVLEQMQEIYPVNEDGQKVYAITAWSDWDGYCMANVTQLSLLNGVDTGDQLGSKLPFSAVNFDTMEITSIMDENSAYIDGLRWYFEANQRGLLDPDSMTQTWNTALEKGNAGRVLFGWWLWAVSGYNTPERVNAEDPIGFATVLPTETKVPLYGDNIIGSGWSWAISSKSEHIDRCIEFLDFVCNPDEVFIQSNGPEGETWFMNENGLPELTEKGLACHQDSTIQLNNGGTLSDGGGGINSTPVSAGTFSEKYNSVIDYNEWETYTPERTNLQKDYEAVTGYRTATDMLLANGFYTEMPMANSLIAPMSNEMQIIAAQIGDVIRTQSWLAIYAADEAEFDAIVSAMRESAYELGLEEIMAYNEEAWYAAVELAKTYQ